MKKLSDILPLLETIISHINDGVILFGKQDKVFFINNSAQNLLGIPLEDKVSLLSDVKLLDIPTIFKTYMSNPLQKMSEQSPPAPSNRGLVTTEMRINLENSYKDLEIQCCSTCDLAMEPDLYLLILKDVTQRNMLNSYLKAAAQDLITNDPTMLSLLEKIKRIAPSSANVLLQGESGTGKTHIAKLIHKMSKRSDQPLITLNCAAIPDQLIESELFGHMEGAFNANMSQRQGRFKYADKGTLLLDEIGEIPFHLQAKLLRAIQDQEFEPIGSDQTVKVDVRIIASSNQNLLEMVNQGKFRADLYYRLAVIPLYIPTLSERTGDIPILIRHFCNNLISRGYSNAGMECSSEAMRLMMNYNWPGNVRELENAVEHALICSQGQIVEPESLPVEIINQSKKIAIDARDKFQKSHENILRNEIIVALEKAEGNKTKAARELGVDRSTLWRRMRKLQIHE